MKIVSTFIFLCCVITVCAQTDPIPPSPNAAALGKYGQIPVGLFTGTPQVSIPLWEFKSGHLSLPISLSYSSNGIKVDEIASNVGLGWVLNAGGVVTRSVMDDPDSGVRLTKPDGPLRTDEMLDFLKNLTNVNGGDGEPDIFSFNFNNFSGKFYINSNNVPVIISPVPLEIELLPEFLNEQDPGNTEPQIKITDPTGVVYWFGGENASELSITRTAGAQGVPPVANVTAWYLSLIEHPAGDKIYFKYNKKSIRYNTSLSQSVTRLVDSEIEHSENTLEACPKGTGTYAPPSVHMITTVTSIIDSIYSSKEGSIAFSYSPYLDIASFVRLNKISIKNNVGVNVKGFYLDYSLVKSLGFSNRDVKDHLADIDLNRLFLKRVTEVGSDGRTAPPYTFEYHSPNELPARLSYAQDYWGYFNGKPNAYLVPNKVTPFFSKKEIAEKTIENVFRDVGGDKRADGQYSVKGMLKKITYPTGGFNEFEYEPHSYYAENIIDPPKKREILDVVTESGEGGVVSATQVIGPIPFDHDIRFFPSNVALNEGPEDCDIPGYPTHRLKGSFNVTDLSTGTPVTLYMISPNSPDAISIGSTYTLAQNNPVAEVFFTVKKGISYSIKLSISFECQTAGVSFFYYDKEAKVVKQNIQVGGVRIKRVITDDGFGKKEIKRYQYGDVGCPDCSSGVVEPIRASIAINVNKVNTTELKSTCKHATLTSSTFYPLYSSQGYHIGYPSVIESDGDNFENGRIRHVFNIIADGPANIFNGDMIPGTPLTNNFGNGQELKTIYESRSNAEGNSFSINKVIENKYKHDSRKNAAAYGYKASRYIHSIERLVLPGSGGYPVESSGTVEKPEMFDFVGYRLSSQWHYIDSVITTEIDDLGRSLRSAVSYEYDNPVHMQVTSIHNKNSDGQMIQQHIKYPDDFNNIENIETLRQKNMVALPIKTEKTVDAKLVEGQVTKYNDVGLPIQIYNYESEELKNLPVHDRNLLVPTEDFQLKSSIIYEGDIITDIQTTSKPNSAYLWGYNNSKLIAFATNATSDRIYFNGFEETGSDENKRTGKRSFKGGTFIIPATDFAPSNLEGLVITFWYFSNGKWQFSGESNYTENTISTSGTMIDDIRIYPKGALMTTYTYDPGIGMTSVADPKDLVSLYEYDNLGRLKLIRDDDGNIIKSYTYKYKGTNP